MTTPKTVAEFTSAVILLQHSAMVYGCGSLSHLEAMHTSRNAIESAYADALRECERMRAERDDYFNLLWKIRTSIRGKNAPLEGEIVEMMRKHTPDANDLINKRYAALAPAAELPAAKVARLEGE